MTLAAKEEVIELIYNGVGLEEIAIIMGESIDTICDIAEAL
jgi:hypothetical protein